MGLALLLLAAAVAFGQKITHGPMAGDVTDSTAVLWARCDRECELHFVVGNRKLNVQKATAASDFTGKIRVEDLKPDTRYRYSVAPGDGEILTGEFRTAPAETQPSLVQFAWGGDIAGQNVCRDAREGFPIFDAIRNTPLQFFIGLGDIIYGDNTCEETGRYGNRQIPGGFGPATDLAGYWAHWKYTFGDPGLRRLLGRTPYIPIWDDHEVVNDVGPEHDIRKNAPYRPDRQLMPIGLAAFLDYNPVEIPGAPKRLYRSLRWGKHIEIIILDTRQYRDSNSMPDGPGKTVLGREQLAWLEQTLVRTDATWKIIVSSIPISIPTGSEPGQGRDGWANFDSKTGAESELRKIFELLERSGSYNNLWITTDVHFAAAFEYTPLPAKPDFRVFEVVTGPLNAGLFPNRRFDTTFGTKRLFYYGPGSGEGLTWQQARRWMNFGLIRVEKDGDLRVSIRNDRGRLLWELRLNPSAAAGSGTNLRLVD